MRPADVSPARHEAAIRSKPRAPKSSIFVDAGLTSALPVSDDVNSWLAFRNGAFAHAGVPRAEVHKTQRVEVPLDLTSCSVAAMIGEVPRAVSAASASAANRRANEIAAARADARARERAASPGRSGACGRSTSRRRSPLARNTQSDRGQGNISYVATDGGRRWCSAGNVRQFCQ